jgi:hypothetical protein
MRLRRPKVPCCSSYADYRPKTNAVISLDMGHTLREMAYESDRERGRNQKLEHN